MPADSKEPRDEEVKEDSDNSGAKMNSSKALVAVSGQSQLAVRDSNSSPTSSSGSSSSSGEEEDEEEDSSDEDEDDDRKLAATTTTAFAAAPTAAASRVVSSTTNATANTATVGVGDPEDSKKRKRKSSSGTTPDARWEEMYQRLISFKERNHHCSVPNRFPEDPSLGCWVSTQRRLYKKAQRQDGEGLLPERTAKLEALGFEWTGENPRHKNWDLRFEELKIFRARYGHAQVPIGFKENVQLANWTSTQRQEYKNLLKGRSSRLNDERIKQLNDIGFAWELQRGGRRRLVSMSRDAPNGENANDTSATPGENPSGSVVLPGVALLGGDQHLEGTRSTEISARIPPSLVSASSRSSAASTHRPTKRARKQQRSVTANVQPPMPVPSGAVLLQEAVPSAPARAARADSSLITNLAAQTQSTHILVQRQAEQARQLLSGNLSSIASADLRTLIALAGANQGNAAGGTSSFANHPTLGNGATQAGLMNSSLGLGLTQANLGLPLNVGQHPRPGQLQPNTSAILQALSGGALRGNANLGLTQTSLGFHQNLGQYPPHGQGQAGTSAILQALAGGALGVQQQQHRQAPSSLEMASYLQSQQCANYGILSQQQIVPNAQQPQLDALTLALGRQFPVTQAPGQASFFTGNLLTVPSANSVADRMQPRAGQEETKRSDASPSLGPRQAGHP